MVAMGHHMAGTQGCPQACPVWGCPQPALSTLVPTAAVVPGCTRASMALPQAWAQGTAHDQDLPVVYIP